MSIVLERLTKRYGVHPVVNGVSLDIAEGELFVLLGPSGSGKSTVLRMIAGLSGIDAGRVVIHGRDVTTLPPQLRGIGFVFQHYALFPHMTVAENVEFGLRVRKTPAAERTRRREELLDLVGLAGLGGRYPRQLSGGQQQRVALARALAPHPSVLLLDEPFGALDAKIRTEMRRNLRQVQRELGITTIFVTHDQEEAFELGDQLGVMNFGRLLEAGPPEELYLRPQTEFAATFLGSANLLIGETTATGIRLGRLHFPLHTQAGEPGEPHRVQVLFRAEDIALAPSAEGVSGTPLGRAEVEQVAFVGAMERLRLQLPRIPGVRPVAPVVPFGSDSFLLEAVRSQEEARRFPLAVGATAWVGVHRVHALAHPGLSFLLVGDGSAAAQAALNLGSQLARLAHAQVTVLGAGVTALQLQESLHEVKEHLVGLASLRTRAVSEPAVVALREEVEDQAHDLVVLGIGPQHNTDVIEQVLEAGEHHVLLVPAGAGTAVTRVLLCVAGNEASKDDVLFAGRLIRHLGAEATLLTALEDPQEQQPDEKQRAERFLEAGARTLTLLGVTTRTEMRFGRVPEVIQMAVEQGGYDLLVLGAPLQPLGTARIRSLVSGSTRCPVLLVRSPYAAASLARSQMGAMRVREEMA